MSVRVLIVDDQARFRDVARTVVELTDGFEVVGEVETGEDSVTSARELRPDLVLMDLLMPEMDGVEATRRIMAESPCTILLVTVSVEANSWRVFEAMGHGALDAVDTPVLGAGVCAFSST